MNIPNLNPGSSINYTINESSTLTIVGSSNINKFECTSFQNLSKGTFYYKIDDNTINISNATILLKTKSFDCNNPIYNHNFYKILNADKNPFIKIEILNLTDNTAFTTTNNGKIRATIAITLNNVRRLDEISVIWERNANKTYRFMGTKALQMSNFSIDATDALFGLVKIQDRVIIYFDLNITANSQ